MESWSTIPFSWFRIRLMTLIFSMKLLTYQNNPNLNLKTPVIKITSSYRWRTTLSWLRFMNLKWWDMQHPTWSFIMRFKNCNMSLRHSNVSVKMRLNKQERCSHKSKESWRVPICVLRQLETHLTMRMSMKHWEIDLRMHKSWSTRSRMILMRRLQQRYRR